MHNGVIVLVHPNHDVPQAYWEGVINAIKPNVYGFAVAEKGEITYHTADDPTVESLQAAREIFRDCMAIYYVGNAPTPIDIKSRQPFVIQQTEDGKPAIVAFIEGDYSPQGMENGVASNEFYMAENVLVELATQFWEAAGGDMTKMMKFMGNKISTASIHNASLDRGNVVLLANNGLTHQFQKNDQDMEYDWGAVTKHFDYGVSDYPVKEEAAPVVEPPKELTRAEKLAAAMGTKASATAKQQVVKAGSDEAAKELAAKKQKLTDEILARAAEEKKAEPVKPTPVIVDMRPKVPAKTATAAAPEQTVRLTVPRGNGVSNTATKDFLRKYLGDCPLNWNEMVYIDVPMSKAPVMPVHSPAPVFAKRTEPEHVTTDKVIQAEGHKGSVPPVPANVIVPIIPLAQIKAFNDTFVKSAMMKEIMGPAGEVVPTEADLQAMEKKFPSWEQQTKFPLVRTAHFTHTADLALVRDYPQLAATLLGAYRMGFFKNWKPAVAVQDNGKKTVNKR